MAWTGSQGRDIWEGSRRRTYHMVLTPSRTAQTQVHKHEERRARNPDDQGEHRHEDTERINGTKLMCSITNSVGFRIPPAQLQDIHKVGPPTGIPPTDARPCDRQIATFSTPWGKYRPRRLVLEQNHRRTSSMRWCSEYSGTYPIASTREMISS